MGICWICGARDQMADGRGRPMQDHRVDGNPVKVHVSCADKEGWNKKAPKGRAPRNERTILSPNNHNSYARTSR